VRKEVCLQKAEAVIDYAEQEHLCRTRFLLDYFGEWEYEKCGICDVCLQHKADEGMEGKVFRFRQQIRNAVSINAQSLTELEKALEVGSAKNKNIMLHTVRLMLDEGIIKYNEGGKLVLTKKVKDDKR
jgi:ATP-dependent DNA helicase RecQ